MLKNRTKVKKKDFKKMKKCFYDRNVELSIVGLFRMKSLKTLNSFLLNP